MEHIIPYNVSKDYSRLKELLDKDYRIVCFVDNNMDGDIFVDICSAKKIVENKYIFTARGVEYLSYDDYCMNVMKVQFDVICEMSNIRFIDI